MKITPLEIRQKTFEKVFRGYDKDEVNAYLQSLSMEWERMLDENKELYQRIENLETESTKLRELESSLFKTLKTAEDTGATLIEQAKKETDLKLKESNMQAEAILSEARNKAKGLIEKAESKKKQIIDDMINNIRNMENLFNQMADLKEKVIRQVKNYSADLMERSEKLEKKSEDFSVRDIVAEAKKIYNSSVVGEESVSDETAEESGRIEETDTKPEKQKARKEKAMRKKGKHEQPEVEREMTTQDPEDEDKGEFPGNDQLDETLKGDEKEVSSLDTEKEDISTKENKRQSENGFEETRKERKSSSTSFFDEID
jgi:cell division initiation protein